jgi:hypothetical protein
MKKTYIFLSIILLLFFSGCGNTKKVETTQEKNVTKETTSEATTEASPSKEEAPSEVKEMEKLIEEYLMAYNEVTEEEFTQQLKDVFLGEFLPHYSVDYRYHQFSELAKVRFGHSVVKENPPQFETEVTFQFVDGEGSPREITQFVVSNFLEEEGTGLRLSKIQFYESPDDIENRTYTAFNFMTKNLPVTHYGVNFGLENVVNPVGRENEQDPFEFTIFRNLVVLYQAQYLETDPVEYNRKARFIFHPEVLDEVLSKDTRMPINGNLTALDVTTIEHEDFVRKSDAMYYRGYYHFIFYDVQGNETEQYGEVSAKFKQSEDGIKLVTFNMDFY